MPICLQLTFLFLIFFFNISSMTIRYFSLPLLYAKILMFRQLFSNINHFYNLSFVSAFFSWIIFSYVLQISLLTRKLLKSITKLLRSKTQLDINDILWWKDITIYINLGIIPVSLPIDMRVHFLLFDFLRAWVFKLSI